MSSHDDFNEDAAQRTNRAPYTPRHPVPTVQRYQSHREERQAVANAQISNKPDGEDPQGGEHQGLLESTKRFLHMDGSSKDEGVDETHPYESANRNVQARAEKEDGVTNDHRSGAGEDHGAEPDQSAGESGLKDTSETIYSTLDPRQKRKNMKHMGRDHASREVTDPVTHLKVTIHDTTDKELGAVPENEPPPNSSPRNTTGTSKGSKTELDKETDEQQDHHDAMERLFPPPAFNTTRERISGIYVFAFTVALCTILVSLVLMFMAILFILRKTGPSGSWSTLLFTFSSLIVTVGAIGGGLIWFLKGWLKNKIKSAWDDEVWTAAREQESATADSPLPESTQWLNSLLSSVWSLINPDLFVSLADTLEDVMQASLPKLVRMISVEDLGQGNESIRILGIRWLPTGAAAQKVSEDGQVTSSNAERGNDRKVPGQGEVDDDAESSDEHHNPSGGEDHSKENEKNEGGSDQNIKEGMEAEEGDFVNIEVAFSYRASKSGKSLRLKSRNAHLYLAFYLPGNIRFRKLIFLSSESNAPMLTILSCVGRTSRYCGNHAHASSTVPRSTLFRSVYTYAPWTTQG